MNLSGPDSEARKEYQIPELFGTYQLPAGIYTNFTHYSIASFVNFKPAITCWAARITTLPRSLFILTLF